MSEKSDTPHTERLKKEKLAEYPPQRLLTEEQKQQLLADDKRVQDAFRKWREEDRKTPKE